MAGTAVVADDDDAVAPGEHFADTVLGLSLVFDSRESAAVAAGAALAAEFDF